MVEAIIGLTVAILSLVAHYLDYRQSDAGRRKKEDADVDKHVQEMREALESGDPIRIAIAFADQRDRVRAALRSSAGRRKGAG